MSYDLTQLAHAAQAVRDRNAQVADLRVELNLGEASVKAHQEHVQHLSQRLRDAQYELHHAQRTLDKIVLGGDAPAPNGVLA